MAPRLSIETRENNFSQTLRRRCALEEIRDLSNSIFRSETEGEVRDGACFMVLLHLSECATATRYNRECPRRDARGSVIFSPDMVTPSHRPLLRVIWLINFYPSLLSFLVDRDASFASPRAVDRPLFDAAVDRGQLGEHRVPDVCARNDKRYVAFRDEGKSVTGDIDPPSHLQRKSWMENFVADVRARLNERRCDAPSIGNFIYSCKIKQLLSDVFLITNIWKTSKEILYNWRNREDRLQEDCQLYTVSMKFYIMNNTFIRESSLC